MSEREKGTRDSHAIRLARLVARPMPLHECEPAQMPDVSRNWENCNPVTTDVTYGLHEGLACCP